MKQTISQFTFHEDCSSFLLKSWYPLSTILHGALGFYYVVEIGNMCSEPYKIDSTINVSKRYLVHICPRQWSEFIYGATFLIFCIFFWQEIIILLTILEKKILEEKLNLDFFLLFWSEKQLNTKFFEKCE